jgi:hypothetical protein
MSQEPTRTIDQALLAAWQTEFKASHNLNIKQQCLQQESELLPRFGEHYQHSSKPYAGGCAAAWSERVYNPVAPAVLPSTRPGRYPW